MFTIYQKFIVYIVIFLENKGGFYMAKIKEDYFQELSNAVVDMDEDKAREVALEVVKNKIDVFEAIDRGLSHGMARAGLLYEEEEYFIPELLLCADAMYEGLEILKPHVKALGEGEKEKIIIGVIQGDTHDIGKNIVKMMLETAGYHIYDLGRDVPPRAFLEKANEVNAKIIAVGTLMSTTMDGMLELINLLKANNTRVNHKVMIGGGPVSQAFADRIGADAYAPNAMEAVRIAKELLA